jgi:hypothetical protein
LGRPDSDPLSLALRDWGTGILDVVNASYQDLCALEYTDSKGNVHPVSQLDRHMAQALVAFHHYKRGMGEGLDLSGWLRTTQDEFIKFCAGSGYPAYLPRIDVNLIRSPPAASIGNQEAAPEAAPDNAAMDATALDPESRAQLATAAFDYAMTTLLDLDDNDTLITALKDAGYSTIDAVLALTENQLTALSYQDSSGDSHPLCG